MSRNSQYILTDGQNGNENKDIQLEASYWKLQLLNRQIIDGIDTVITEEVKDNLTTPTDLAIKEYFNSKVSGITIERNNLGDRENYYGVYSGMEDANGLNSFVRVANKNIAVIVSEASPLEVKIDNKRHKIYSINSVKSNSYLPQEHYVTITVPNSGTEQTKYLTEVSYSSIVGDNGRNFYILEIVNGDVVEYSTVRVDRVNKKLIFEHCGSTRRGQWRSSLGNISDIQNINNGRYRLLEIGYVFVELGDDNKTYTPFVSYAEPQVIYGLSNQNIKHYDDSYHYNLIDEKWYKQRKNYADLLPAKVQMIGMVGVGTLNMKEFVCTFSLPNYFLKSQKNTIQLEKDGLFITSKSGSNVVFHSSDIFQQKNHFYRWEIPSKFKNKTVFLYIDSDGLLEISDKRPQRTVFGGYYLNNRNWRCVGSVFVNKNGQLSNPWDFNGSKGDIEEYGVDGLAQIPLGFKGTIIVKQGGITTKYDSREVKYVIPVKSGATVEYKGEING